MLQVNDQVVSIHSNIDIVTTGTQGDINTDLHRRSVDKFRLEEVTSVENIHNEALVSISDLPQNIHTVQQQHQDTTPINEYGLGEATTLQNVQKHKLVMMKDSPQIIPTVHQVQRISRNSSRLMEISEISKERSA